MTQSHCNDFIPPAKTRDGLPALPHFANVMVANGKVYIGTYDSLAVYGLF